MKGLKYIVILALVLLFGASWYSLYTGSAKAQAEYEGYLEMARKKADMEIYTDADAYYKAAYDMKESLDLRCEMAQFYKRAGMNERFEKWCRSIIEAYPKKEEGYLYLAQYFKELEDTEKCYEVIFEADKRRLTSEPLKQIDRELAYRYELGWEAFNGVGSFSFGYCPVENEKELWGFVNEMGSQVVSFMYQSVNSFMPSGYASVLDSKGEYSLIDENGNKKFIDVEKKDLEDCGLYFADKMSVKENGRFYYADREFHKLFGDYDFAGTFNAGYAAVENAGEWILIDEQGNQAFQESFEDIKLDGLSLAVRNGVIFVKKGGAYQIRNMAGERVGTDSWEDVKQFATDKWTCVLKNGKWGYIDTEGNETIKAEYEDARPFSYGLAAVLKNGKWGYINKKNEMVIPAEFEEAKDFTKSATVFVKTNGSWKILSLLRGSILKDE